GVGGVNISLYGNDPTLFFSNPALASDSLANRPTVNYTAFPTGVGFSSATYSHSFKKAGLWSAGVQYLSYGKIDGYDDSGNPTDSFKPNDYAVIISHVRSSNNFRFGASLKQVGLNIAGFSSNATLFDLGGVFVHPSQLFTVGMTIKNMGFQWSKISESVDSTLPFDMQLGASIKPLHMPFRFSLTLYKLNQWDLTLPNETTTNEFTDNLMRHVVIGTELLINKHINILFGYNHLRKRELKVENAGGFSGFSVGLNIKTKAFEFVYAYGGYNVAGNANMLTLNVDLNQLVK
ncbi:MAG: type IX secretion system protein PorQ, partial [Cyclobacteriaceae bacterium]|nr:type IX secretion system protein PorQ [Cyclobacteriaceae bacterium]